MAAPLGTALATIAEWRGPHVLYCENFEGRFSATAGPPAVIFEDDLTYSYLAPGAMGGMPGHALVLTRSRTSTST